MPSGVKTDLHAVEVEQEQAENLPGSPVEIVRSFLALMQTRTLPAAEQYLAPQFTMRFPGSPEMTRLDKLVEWSRPRYRSISKTVLSYDSCAYSDHFVVYCHGTLAGEWHDGSSFAGVRFVDRFELREGLLCRQDVWNDLALCRD